MKIPATVKAAMIKGRYLIAATIIGAIITGVFYLLKSRNSVDNSVKTDVQHNDALLVGRDANNVESTTVKTGNQSFVPVGDIDINNLTIYQNVPSSATKDAIKVLEDKVEDVNTTVALTRNELKKLAIALKDLDQRTTGIEKLPDGRTRIGAIITGYPTIVVDEHSAAATFYKARDFISALEHSERAIQAYEETQQEVAKIKSNMRSGDLNDTNASRIYYLGAYCAHKLNKHGQAYRRAEKANSIKSHPELIKLLAITLFNVNRKADALRIVDDGLVKYPNNTILINIRNELSKRELFKPDGYQ